MKRARKQFTNLLGTTFLAAGGSLGLGAIGGQAATHGQQGIANMMRFAPAAGSVIGAGMMLRTVRGLDYGYKRKKRNHIY